MRKLNVVQIGVGHGHAYASIDALKTRDDVNLLGYVKFIGEEEMFDRYKDKYLTVKEMSLQEVYAIKDLDAVFIETVNEALTKYAYEFVKRGVAVQMDKPGSQDKKSFDVLFDLAERTNIPIHMGYMYRYNPAIKKTLEMVKSGDLGKIYYVEAQMNCIYSNEKRKWLKEYKGGMMNVLGCHLVDLLLQINGCPTDVIPFNMSTDKEYGEDVGFVVFKYNDLNSFIKSTAVEFGGFTRRQIVVCGEKGTIEINPTERFESCGTKTDMYITLSEKCGYDWSYRAKKIEFGPYDRYFEMYDEFFRIVRKEIVNPYSYKYEKTVHDTLLKACGINIE